MCDRVNLGVNCSPRLVGEIPQIVALDFVGRLAPMAAGRENLRLAGGSGGVWTALAGLLAAMQDRVVGEVETRYLTCFSHDGIPGEARCKYICLN